MKSFLLALIFIFSAPTFAELKPEWSIVPYQCGTNTSPVAMIDSPVSACMASVTGHNDFSIVFFTYEDGSKTYFLITDKEFRIGANTLVLEEVEVSEARYTLLNDLKNGGEVKRMSVIMNRGMILKGGDFSAVMEPVFSTQSF